METESSTKYKTCLRCKEILPIYHFRFKKEGYHNSYCKPCEVGVTHEWRENNKERSALNYLEYFTSEVGFIRSSIGSKFKPSNVDQIRKDVANEEHAGHRKPKAYAPEMTKQQFWEELILHIQFMKDKHPGSDGRLCRICEQPWTYLRGKPNVNGKHKPGSARKRYPKNFSIDRYDNSQTYKIGNVIFVCVKCNQTKNASEKWMWLRLLEIEKELNESKTD